MYTILTYQYRDSSNYKTAERVAFAGAITPEQETRFMQNLLGDEQFYPEQVDLEVASFGGSYDDDNFHVNEFCNFRTVDHTPRNVDLRTIDEFIDEFTSTTWVDPLHGQEVLYSVTVTEVEALAGRTITEDEVDVLRRALGHSSIPEAVREVVFAATGSLASDEDES